MTRTIRVRRKDDSATGKNNKQRTTNKEQQTKNNEQRKTNKEQATVHSGSIFTCNKCRLPSGTVIIFFFYWKSRSSLLVCTGWAGPSWPAHRQQQQPVIYLTGTGRGRRVGGGGCGSGHLAPRQSRKSGPRQTVAAQNGTWRLNVT